MEALVPEGDALERSIRAQLRQRGDGVLFSERVPEAVRVQALAALANIAFAARRSKCLRRPRSRRPRQATMANRATALGLLLTALATTAPRHQSLSASCLQRSDTTLAAG